MYLIYNNLVLNLLNSIDFLITINKYTISNMFRCHFNTPICVNVFVYAEGQIDINRCY